MAQIIKHKRGSLEKLSSVTGSLQKGELVIATGSVKLGNVTNGEALVFAAYESGAISATNRILRGDVAPIFSASTYNGMLDGVPFYASASNTLFLLGSDTNEAIDLSGNISDFSSSVSASIANLSSSIQSVTGDFSSSVATSFSASAFTVSQLSASVASDLNSLSGSLTSSIGETQTSITNLSSSVNNISGAFATSTSASNASIASLSASVASVTGDFSSSVATSFSASAASQTALSGAVATTISNLSSSLATTDSASKAEYTSFSASAATQFNSFSSSQLALNATYATTGSNIFFGTQTITGSLYITNDLVVQGSSSLQNITASAVSIGTNTVILNTATPAVRFGGISVADSGSGAGASGSLFWDSLNNHWIYQHPSGGAESGMSARLISGPKNSGSLGEEAGLTTGKIVVAVGDDHIGDSIMEQSSSTIIVSGDLDVTGEISSSTIAGIGNVTLYSQSVDSRVATLETSLGGGGSVGTRVANLETISASYLTFTQSYYSDSASFDTRISDVVGDLDTISGSVYTQFSASNASQLALSTSVDSRLDAEEFKSTTFATTGSNTFIGTQTISGSVNVSGSTNFNGAVAVNDSNMNLTNSSSLNLTSGSSLFVNGPGTISGSITGIGNVTLFSQSVDSRFSASAASQTALSGALYTTIDTLSSSVDTRLDTLETSLGGGGSIGTRVGNLETISASYLAFTQSYYSDSASFATAISASDAEYTSFSASAATAISASNASQLALSTSVDSRLDAEEFKSTTFATTGSNSFTGSQGILGDVTVSGSVYIQFGQDLVTNHISGNQGRIELGNSDNNINIVADNELRLTATGSGVHVHNTNFSVSPDGLNNNVLVVSASITTVTNEFSASNISGVGNIGAFSQSVDSRFSASAYSVSQLSASVASVTGDFSSSVATSFSASKAEYTSFSASAASDLNSVSGAFATSTSASNAAIAALSASVASTTGDFSSSIATQFSASVASVVALSSSVSSDITNLSSSLVTSISASNANEAAWSASIASRATRLEASQSAFDTAFELTGSSVTILGDLRVIGTQSVVNSTTIDLGDNILSLNGTAGAFGGLIVKDPTAPSTFSGSLLWDTTNDYWIAGKSGSEAKVLLAVGDSVVSSSSQITLSSTTGFSSFDTAISTSFSAGAYNVSSLSASVASVTGDFSSSVATSFSASAFTVSQLSSSVATSFSASAFTATVNSASAASDLNSVSGAFATSISASNFTIVDNSSSFATSLSASNASISSLSASVASVTGDFSSSVATSFSASAASLTALSASIYLTDATQSTDITNNSSSFATSISASNFRITILETTIDGGSY